MLPFNTPYHLSEYDEENSHSLACCSVRGPHFAGFLDIDEPGPVSYELVMREVVSLR